MSHFPECPECGCAIIDNRPQQALGLMLNLPAIKCSDRACNWAVWPSGKKTMYRSPVTNAPAREGPIPCGICGVIPEWHRIWMLRLEESGLRFTDEWLTQPRLLYRHEEGRSCAKYNASHKWADGPQPERRVQAPPSDEETIKARLRERLRNTMGAA